MRDTLIEIVKQALNEDIGTGDVSASLLTNKRVKASIITRKPAIICGIAYAQQAFLLLDDSIQLDWRVKDGEAVTQNQVLCVLHGLARGIVSAERVALNFLQTLSATATATHNLLEKIKHTKTRLLDSRKTIPNLRLPQKYAVQCGGGVNHRMGLYDCVMLKENHIAAIGSIENAVKTAVEKYPNLPLIIEVENLSQLQQALKLEGITRIVCDNFSPQNLKHALSLSAGKLPLEASGNIDAQSIVEIANTGVDYISTGSITKNIQAIDLSLRFS